MISTLLLLAALITGCAKPIIPNQELPPALLSLEQEKQRSLALTEQLKRRQRVMNISFPLMVAAADFCADKVKPSLGISFSNKEGIDKSYRDTAIQDLGLGDALQVILVAEGSPAATAGIAAGDVLVSVDDKPFKSGKKAGASVKALLASLKAGQPVDLVVARADKTITVEITPSQICDYPILISNQDTVNAYANGRQIILTKGLLRFSEQDSDLALVIAHELAHNAFGHVPKIVKNAFTGVAVDLLAFGFGIPSPAAFTITGANLHRQQFEAEADHIALYILARSGQPIDHAADFWRRVAAEYPDQIDKNIGASHPSSPERFLAIESTVKIIKEKRRRGDPLWPEGLNKKSLNKLNLGKKSDGQ
ncbi:MAG: M48 family metalloprotease [Motiliproteus sp.]|nr:M48 family metalloprotease [Motiliproteus sp.]MCW9051550.1 M48 family metalloprotease [Motiliproteus sp.]